MVKPRILIVVRKLEIGSVESALVSIANNLDRNKFDVTLCFTEDGDYGALIRERADLVKLKSRNTVLVLLELRKLFAKSRFDFVLHSWPKLALSWFLLSHFLGPRFRKVRKIIRMPVSLTSYVRRNPLLNNFLFKWLFSRTLNFHDNVVASCENIAQELKTDFRVSPERVSVIRDPVDVTYIRTKAAEFDPFDQTRTGPIIVSLGWFEDKNWFNVLLKAFQGALDMFRDELEKAKLVIVGNSQRLRKLGRLAAKLGLVERVSIVDQTLNLYPYLKNADLVVLPSRFDGFPNVFIEALACGAKVIYTDCPIGPTELSDQDGRYGWFAAAENPYSLASKITEALRSPAKPSDEVLQEFRLEHAVAQYEALVSSLIQPRIIFFISDLGSGGAQRVLSTFARYLRCLGARVTVIALRDGAYKTYLDSAGVSTTVLDLPRARTSIRKVFQMLRDLKPDVVVASLIQDALVMTILKQLNLTKAKFVYRPSNQVEKIFPRGRRRLVGRIVFKTADLVIFQTDRMRETAEKIFPIVKRKGIVLPNPVDFDYVKKMSEEFQPFGELEDVIRIVSVGRLTFQKGFDVLLRAFARVKARVQNAVLFILGDGKERTNLENLARELGVRDSVRFVGWVSNPFPYYRHADVFVLASRYEGTPNALLEAIACGTKVVATDCPTGPREVIGLDERCGWLAPVDDDEALAEKILQAIGSYNKSVDACLKFYDAKRLAFEFFEKIKELREK